MIRNTCGHFNPLRPKSEFGLFGQIVKIIPLTFVKLQENSNISSYLINILFLYVILYLRFYIYIFNQYIQFHIFIF